MLNSGLFWEYWAEKKDCGSCPLRQKCLNETDKAGARKLQDSYFKTAVQQHFFRQWESEYREALKQRQIWCEGTFAAQKWGHNLTRLLRRGLEAAEDHCLLLQYIWTGKPGSQSGFPSISCLSYNERSNWLTNHSLGLYVRVKDC